MEARSEAGYRPRTRRFAVPEALEARGPTSRGIATRQTWRFTPRCCRQATAAFLRSLRRVGTPLVGLPLTERTYLTNHGDSRLVSDGLRDEAAAVNAVGNADADVGVAGKP
jgi:hypothetical protein